MKRILGGLTGDRDHPETTALVSSREALLVAIAKMADARDDAGGGHIDRMMRYAELIGTAMRGRARRALFSREEIHWLKLGAALHDIGKASISDDILLKPGLLNDAERLTMQEHTVIGARCLDRVIQDFGPDAMISTARQVIRSHHERWDGGGYPDHLAGSDIPIVARIVALCDVYDALTRRRVYKLAMTHEQAGRIITEGSGTQFDPAVIQAFEAVIEEIAAVSLTVQGSTGDEEVTAPRYCRGIPDNLDIEQLDPDDDPPPRVA